jgi:hypothetical protein
MQRTSQTTDKAQEYDARQFTQPTRDSIAAALAAQRREREAFAKTTGSRVDGNGRMNHSPRQH